MYACILYFLENPLANSWGVLGPGRRAQKLSTYHTQKDQQRNERYPEVNNRLVVISQTAVFEAGKAVYRPRVCVRRQTQSSSVVFSSKLTSVYVI